MTQVDVLSCLHLDGKNKDVMSLFTRLFPTKTTTEVLTSQFGEMVGMALTAVIGEISAETAPGMIIDLFMEFVRNKVHGIR